ncbi:hypothetical protein WKK05_20855 [Nostoc sp. UHCC 0302]|uniref:hypothetical protein n=1 Tax=Nostoc sp. UHCC 0302 TaxID=3134896 RepID=UPI00311CC7F3
MKAIKRFAAISIAILAFVFVGLICIPAAKEVQAQGLKQLVITSEIPVNPDIPLVTSRLEVNSNFAWQDFIALNWPADCEGNPLVDKKIGEAPEAPRVWEFYRTPGEVFLPKGKNPSTIQLTKPLTCQSDNKHELKLLRITESGKLVTKDEFRKAEIIASRPLLDDKSELTVPIETIFPLNEDPVIDQQGNYIINEIHINPVEFNQIVKNKWYDASNLEGFNDEQNKWFQLACSKDEEAFTDAVCPDDEQAGAIEIKAAWRVFNDSTSNTEKSRYYTTKQQLLIPGKSDECDAGKAVCSDTGEEFSQVVELGLIGLHIVHKTSRQGWIWSTFEQIDNVPDGNPEQGRRYTLFNPDCSGTNCDTNTFLAKAPFLWRQQTPHAVTKVGGKIETQIPSQIVREAKIIESSADWQKELRKISDSSVWQYYKLIGTEWLGNPQTPYNENIRQLLPQKPVLANVALEAYHQGVSCINCHSGASLPNKAHADFSFLMNKAQSSNLSVRQEAE